MKKSIKKIIANSLNQDKEQINSGFYVVKGGMSLFLYPSANKACTNDGTSCSGTNEGACVNKAPTDCSKATNSPATSCKTS
ncbi:MAG: hypothetical protein M3O71_07265 [Bacteroidota bacterium]|nr:hypothetical protein [Bacteroidota bacterium]